jgi:hypothetical protein
MSNGTIMVDTIKLEGLKAELINMLRWEDDGGKNNEFNYSMLDQPFVQPVLLNGGRKASHVPAVEQAICHRAISSGHEHRFDKEKDPNESPEHVTKYTYYD